MSGNISDTAVIVIVIVAAGAAVLVGYAVHAAFTRGSVDPYETAMQRNDDQDRYMRELREKNYAGIRQDARWPTRPMPTHKHDEKIGNRDRQRESESPDY